MKKIEGANCQTLFGRHASQQDAAIEAVKRIGLNQISDVKITCFERLPQYYDMFCRRLECLKQYN